MIEVHEHMVGVQFLQDTCVTPAIRTRKVDQIACGKALLTASVRIEDIPPDPLHECRVSRSEGLTSRQAEHPPIAFSQADELAFKRFRKLTGAQLERGRALAEGIDDRLVAFGKTDPVVKREKGIPLDRTLHRYLPSRLRRPASLRRLGSPDLMPGRPGLRHRPSTSSTECTSMQRFPDHPHHARCLPRRKSDILATPALAPPHDAKPAVQIPSAEAPRHWTAVPIDRQGEQQPSSSAMHPGVDARHAAPRSTREHSGVDFPPGPNQPGDLRRYPDSAPSGGLAQGHASGDPREMHHHSEPGAPGKMHHHSEPSDPGEMHHHPEPAELSDLELIACCLAAQRFPETRCASRQGRPGRSLQRASTELRQAGSLRQLLRRHPRLNAACELVRRSLGEELREVNLLNNTRKVEEFLALWIRDRSVECFVVLFLNARFQLISAEEMFRGTINQTAVYPREIARRALLRNATAVILAHNHPSGAFEASVPDRLLTDAIASALQLLDIALVDHWIVAGNKCLSFAQRGWIPALRT